MTHRRHPRRPIGHPAQRAVLLVAVLTVPILLSGCLALDFFTPNKEPDETLSGHGLVRVWVAAKPGGLGPEFAHYNVSFGYVGHAVDAYLNDFRPMKAEEPTVDLVFLEAAGKSKLLGQIAMPEGEYFGIAVTTTNARVGIEKIVGSQDGQPVTQIEERNIPHQTTPGVDHPTHIRVGHAVGPRGITDLYIEVDLTRSLIQQNGGLMHRTIPHAVSIYGNGAKIGRELYDGGREARLDNGGPDLVGYGGRDLDPNRFDPPYTEIDVYDPDTDRQLYSGRGMPGKRMHHAVGLHQDIRFAGSDSLAQWATEEGRGRIEAFRWNFGDGDRASRSAIIKNYTQGGLYDVELVVRDAKDLVGRDHMTLFVPYTADQAEATRSDARAGTMLIGSGSLGDLADDYEGTTSFLYRNEHDFDFPEELDNGNLRLGAYRTTLRFGSPGGSVVSGVTAMTMKADSGHFDGRVTGLSPLVMETAGIPVWRGPLNDWVSPELTIDVELLTGAAVDYELTVEAFYFYNLSRGLDPHPADVHGTWNFGPIWTHLDWTGEVRSEDDE